MSTVFLHHLWALTALGCGLIGGVFFAFSTFVLPALARLPASQGIAAMQSINRVVLNPLFLGPFFATALGGLALVVLTWRGLPAAGAVAGPLYGVGTFGVTVVGNVPLNNELAKLEPAAAGAEAVWRRYVARWGRFNHVRTAAALLACAVLIYAHPATA